MKKSNLIYGLIGLIIGAVVSFLVFYPPVNEVKDAEGKMADCPVRTYKVGEMIGAQCNVRPNQHCTYQDRSGCDYILKNVGSMPIKAGETVQIMFQIVADNGSLYLEVEHPTG